MNDNLRVFTLMMLTVLAIVILVGGLALLVSWWIQEHFGETAVAATWIIVVLLLVFFGSWWMNQRTMQISFNAIIDFQSADDRGEVARQQVKLENARSDRALLEATIWGVKREQPAPDIQPTQRAIAAPEDWTRAELSTESEWAVIE